MTLISNTYYALRCNARMSNPIYPTCQAVSDGGYDDSDTVLKNALVAGWSEAHGKHYCPAHTQVETPVDIRSARKPRTKPAPPEPETHSHGEEHQS